MPRVTNATGTCFYLASEELEPQIAVYREAITTRYDDESVFWSFVVSLSAHGKVTGKRLLAALENQFGHLVYVAPKDEDDLVDISAELDALYAATTKQTHRPVEAIEADIEALLARDDLARDLQTESFNRLMVELRRAS